MSTSSYLSRRLCVDKPTLLSSLPEHWPQRGAQLRIDPPALLDPGKAYRVTLDFENGTATVTEDVRGASW